MSGARRCCCGSEPNVPTDECGCDGPVYVSIESLNAQQTTTVCQATPICSGQTPNGWSGDQIVTTLEASIKNVEFECFEDPDKGFIWRLVSIGSNGGEVTIDLGTASDDFDFSSSLDGLGSCDDTFSPFGTFSVSHQLDDLPDGCTVVAFSGTIENKSVWTGSAFETRALLNMTVWLEYVDLYDITWLVVDSFTSPTVRQVGSPNPRVKAIFRIDAVGDQPYGDGVCPSDISWTAWPSSDWWLNLIPEVVGPDIEVGHLERDVYVDCAPPGTGDCDDIGSGTLFPCSSGQGGAGNHPLFPILSYISHWSTWTADTAVLTVSETPI